MILNSNHTDQDLIARLNAGSTNVFEIIYRRYEADYRFARKTIFEEEECEESVQEVFISLWERHSSPCITFGRHHLFFGRSSHAKWYELIKHSPPLRGVK